HRVRGHTPNEHVVAFACYASRKPVSLGFVEVAAVIHAACKYKTPLPRLDREFGRCKHIPDCKRPLEVRIRAIARVPGQIELGAREVANRKYGTELLAQAVGRVWIFDDVLYVVLAAPDV